jgi:hypothetical protein
MFKVTKVKRCGSAQGYRQRRFCAVLTLAAVLCSCDTNSVTLHNLSGETLVLSLQLENSPRSWEVKLEPLDCATLRFTVTQDDSLTARIGDSPLNVGSSKNFGYFTNDSGATRSYVITADRKLSGSKTTKGCRRTIAPTRK